jgi:hypothetical protein
VTDNDRPFASANITRLRVLFRECRADVGMLEEIRDELRRSRTSAAKALLNLVEKELDALADKQANFMYGEKSATDVRSPSDKESVKVPDSRILSPREAAAQKRIMELRMRLLDLSNSNRLLSITDSAADRAGKSD